MDTFALLADPTRRRILTSLAAGEHTVGELQVVADAAQPAVSKHLRVLRDHRLVTARVDGPCRRYRLTPGPLRELDDWLLPFRDVWAGRLDALSAHLDRTAAEQDR